MREFVISLLNGILAYGGSYLVLLLMPLTYEQRIIITMIAGTIGVLMGLVLRIEKLTKESYK
jgi:hypothetical protein